MLRPGTTRSCAQALPDYPKLRPGTSTSGNQSSLTFTPRDAKSALERATADSSVVQTGVKSSGWLNKIVQESLMKSENLMGPLEVSASKSGALSPSRSPMFAVFE